MNPQFFFSCDWGTTHFRLRLIRTNDGAVLGEVQTTDGVAQLAREESNETQRASRYREILCARVQELLGAIRVRAEWCVVSGMAGSRMGWKELPYASLPVALSGTGLIHEVIPCVPGDLSVLLVSGLKDECDVLRGEEVEIIGLAGLLPSLAQNDCVVIMPGTHSKHVRLKDGKITGFATLMTGELFAHLHSVPTLQMCLSAGGKIDAEDSWFVRGVRESTQAGLAPSLFKIRAGSLLHGVTGGQNSAFLSGLLIGDELSHLPKGATVCLAADKSLGALYLRAAQELGFAIESIAGDLLKKATVVAHRRILRLVAGI